MTIRLLQWTATAAIGILVGSIGAVAQEASNSSNIPYDSFLMQRSGGSSVGDYAVTLHRNGAAELFVKRSAVGNSFPAGLAKGQSRGKVEIEDYVRLYILANEIHFEKLESRYGFARPVLPDPTKLGALEAIGTMPNPLDSLDIFITATREYANVKEVGAENKMLPNGPYSGPAELQKLQAAIDAVAQSITWASH